MIGVLGGTFDPVHCGHLRAAIEVYEALSLDEIYLLPARLPNLRESPSASAEHRLAMLRLAVSDSPLQIDARELAGTGVSYSIDTLHALRRERPRDSLCFILGQDALNGLTRWHRWQELLDVAHLIVATRPGFSAPEAPELVTLLTRVQTSSAQTLRAALAGRILLQPIPLLPISATDLRARIRAGRSVAHLTPPGVVEYIAQHRLYQP
ncbi:MAG: nicotinate-nucleotide adenylyltransferase [Gammaproteobacteria bacterium]|nr:nicotinate-nucleotide adenylyltransferase [Gammaproteobacteria bacterium]